MSSLNARQVLISGIVLLLGISFAFMLLVGKPDPVSEALPEVAPPLVDVLRAQPATRSIPVYSQGTVQALREVSLASRVAGRVETVSGGFAEGAFFAAGEQLLTVEEADYRFALVRARSQLAAAEQRLAEERGRALQARREWRDLGADEANALFLRKPQQAAAEAARDAAQADLEAARLDLERTRISLPFAGRVSRKFVDVGQYLGPGTVVAEVYATDAVQVRLPLSDQQVALLDLPLSYRGEAREGGGSVVRLQARFGGQNWEWQGQIVRTDASIDVESRMLGAVVEVSAPFARQVDSERPPLAPGLFVHAQIEGRPLAGVSLLPRKALREDSKVMLVDDGGKTLLRAIEVLQQDAHQVWVRGLESGERVVISDLLLGASTGRVRPRDVQWQPRSRGVF